MNKEKCVNCGIVLLISIAFFLSGLILSLDAKAHEMTPTYPKWERSHLSGILKAKMELFNKRNDVEYYEVGVFDEGFEPVPFVSAYSVVKLEYLGKVVFDVFINSKDKSRVVYVCSKSKLRKEELMRTAVSSRICSKFKD